MVEFILNESLQPPVMEPSDSVVVTTFDEVRLDLTWFRQNDNSTPSCAVLKAKEKDLYRRKGEGRRCFYGDRIGSIPCRTTDLAPG